MPLTTHFGDDPCFGVQACSRFAFRSAAIGDRADLSGSETLPPRIAKRLVQPCSNLPAWVFTILRNLFPPISHSGGAEWRTPRANYAKT